MKIIIFRAESTRTEIRFVAAVGVLLEQPGGAVFAVDNDPGAVATAQQVADNLGESVRVACNDPVLLRRTVDIRHGFRRTRSVHRRHRPWH